MAIRHLTFFDKKGNNLNPKYDKFFEFDLFLDKVSTGLFETEHLFIFEEVLREIEDVNWRKDTSRLDNFAPLQIRILKYIQEYLIPVPKKSLEQFFDVLRIDTDPVGDWISKNSHLLQKINVSKAGVKPFDVVVLEILEAGPLSIEYLELLLLEKNYTLRTFLDWYDYSNRKDYINYDSSFRKYSVSSYGQDVLANYRRVVDQLISAGSSDLEEFYVLSVQGEKVVYDWNLHQANLLNSQLHRTVEYVRPRSNLSPEGEAFLFFNWEQEDDDKFFIFFVDGSGETFQQSTPCLSTDTSFPLLVRTTNQDFNPTVNSNWRVFSEPYLFDDGRNDKFEQNTASLRRVLTSVEDLNQRPLQINIGVQSSTEGAFRRTLNIWMARTVQKIHPVTKEFTDEFYTESFIVARVNVYAEFVAEEERFRALLENFGRRVNEDYLKVFRDTDVDEESPDYIKLNEKRKELLISGDEIYPYLGSYKCFVNALKFFGFSDLRLKEYFINVNLLNYNQNLPIRLLYQAVDIPLDLDFSNQESRTPYNNLVYGKMLDSNFYKKTSRFGLFYDLNRLTGRYDAHGLPETEPADQFTNDEVLIKLYGLKTLLQRDFLPHHTRIIDISGEGVYYQRVQTQVWNTKHQEFRLDLKDSVDFVGRPRTGKIKDLKGLLEVFSPDTKIVTSLATAWRDLDDFSKTQTTPLFDYLRHSQGFTFDKELPLEEFKSYFSTKDDLRAAIVETAPDFKGHPVVLEISPRKIKIKDMHFKLSATEIRNWRNLGVDERSRLTSDNKGKREFVDLPGVSKIFTVNNLVFRHAAEITWRIEHVASDFFWEKTGKGKDLRKIIAFLPLTGEYSVTLTVKGFDNFPIYRRRKSYFKVSADQPDIIAFGRNRIPLKNLHTKVKNIKGSLGSPNLGSGVKTTAGELSLPVHRLRYANYLHQNFVDDFPVSTSEVKEITSTSILIKGVDFLLDLKYLSQRRQNTILLKSERGRQIKQAGVLEITSSSIKIKGEHKLKPSSQFYVYQYEIIKPFQRNDVLIFPTTHLEVLQKNSAIRVITNDGEEFFLRIVDQIVLPDEIQIKVELGDLKKSQVIAEIRLEHTYHGFVCLRSDVANDVTELFVKNQRSLSSLKDFDVGDLFLKTWEDPSPLPILVTSSVESAGDTLLFFEENSRVCEFDTNSRVVWGEYDLNWANRFSDIKSSPLKKFTDIKIKALKNKTIKGIEYLSGVKLGFVVTKVEHLGGLKIGDQTLTFDFGYHKKNVWLYEAKTQLETADGVFANFSYHIDEDKLKAVAKGSSFRTLIEIEFFGGCLGSQALEKNSTYPDLNFNDWEATYRPGPNSPADWSVIKRDGQQVYTNPTNLSLPKFSFLHVVQAPFKTYEFFCKKLDFTIPTCTPVFFTLDRENYRLPQIWRLWEENKKLLLCKSKKNFLIWNFIEAGVYTLQVDYQAPSGESTVIKKSFVRVR